MRLFILLVIGTIILSCQSDTEFNEIEDASDSNTMEPEVTHSRPNILLIIADDMGLDATPGFNEGDIKPYMPRLTSLMNAGVKFTNFWAAPTCTPTRSNILTGKFGVHTGVTEVGATINSAEEIVHNQLDATTNYAYSHAIIGKWHLSSDLSIPEYMGVDYFTGFANGGIRSYENWDLYQDGSSSNTTTYSSTKLTDLAIDWIGAQSKPWFLWMAYNAPHAPFHFPPENLHYQGNLPKDEASIDANRMPYYLAALESMDTEIGRLLDSMSDEELANTTILFVGDNGTPNEVAQNPYSASRAKGSLYQGGINVPLIVSGAKVTRGGVTEEALVHATDIYSTVLDIATDDTGTIIHNSHSFYGVLSDADSEKRSYNYSEVSSGNTAGYTIRNQTYKLMVLNDKPDRMFNLETDPYEATNVLNNPSNSETLIAEELYEKALEFRNN